MFLKTIFFIGVICLALRGFSDQTLNAVGSLGIALPEVSGLAADPDDLDTFYAIGDRRHEIVQFTIPTDPAKAKVIDLSQKLLKGAAGVRQSQWEAIQVDSSKTAFLLLEDAPQLLIVDLKTREPKRTLDLNVNETHALSKAWKTDAASRGEGLILLEDGLILVAKEKKPQAILLFGPSGATLPKDLRVLQNGPWKTPDENTASLELLHAWNPTEALAKKMTDFSDLSADKRGDIFVLSDETQRVCRIKGPLATKEAQFDTIDCFVFPEKIKQPEALVVQGLRVIVGNDRKSKKGKKPNIHAFTREP